MAIWIKPNGNEIELNDDPSNIEAAKKLGLKKKRAPKKVVETNDNQLDALSTD
jgi:hypothetical protein